MVKPSRYDESGHAVQWISPTVPISPLACHNEVLGENVDARPLTGLLADLK